MLGGCQQLSGWCLLWGFSALRARDGCRPARCSLAKGLAYSLAHLCLGIATPTGKTFKYGKFLSHLPTSSPWAGRLHAVRTQCRNPLLCFSLFDLVPALCEDCFPGLHRGRPCPANCRPSDGIALPCAGTASGIGKGRVPRRGHRAGAPAPGRVSSELICGPVGGPRKAGAWEAKGRKPQSRTPRPQSWSLPTELGGT